MRPDCSRQISDASTVSPGGLRQRHGAPNLLRSGPYAVPALSHAALAEALRNALREAARALAGVDPFPSIDLAVAAFPRGAPPVWANALLSRSHREGLVAEIGDDAGPVRNVTWMADAVDDAGVSIAWLPGADWTRLALAPLYGSGPHRLVAPYPASLAKLMVAVGVARLVDDGRARWNAACPYRGRSRTVAGWAEAMLTVSDNEATETLVALLHAGGLLRPHCAGSPDGLHALFAGWGLPTLRLAGTTTAGGWRNADGAGVGRLQMTAWDTVRLLWLLAPDDARDPAWPALAHPPWRPAGSAPPLSEASRRRLWAWLAAQGQHQVLSTGLLAGVAGWQAGIPARLPARWLRPDGSARVAGRSYPGDLRPARARADAVFAHKTGSTASYGADAGRVVGDGGRDYLIAMTSSLGNRHAPHADCATPWAVARLAAAVDGWLEARLENTDDRATEPPPGSPLR